MTDAFYLKYRPKSINELDLVSVRKRLSAIFEQTSIPHSFLFSGPKGTGKTSAARILAKLLNCPNLKKGKSCNKCKTCLEIEKGEGLDVLEIDAASNRGIDDIRNLKEKISFQPLKGKNKVYIIDEVHMLTREAFNAFLKTLEEPPEHAYFIFCTTNPEKIPDTILSRLTIIEFSKGKKEEIVSSLKKVVKGEKIKIDDKSLEMISDFSDGSFRDAHKLLYQLWIEAGKKVDLQKTKKFLGYFKKLEPEQFLSLLAKKRLDSSLKLAEELDEKGVDFEDYLRKMAKTLKNMLLFSFLVNDNFDDKTTSLANCFTREEIIRLNKLTTKANLEQKTTVVSQLPLEMLAISFLKEKSKSDNKKPKKLKESNAETKSESSSDDKSRFKRKSDNQNGKIKSEKKANMDVSGVVGQWSKVLEAVKPMNHSVGALLRACRPARVEDDCLILEVFYSFHKDRLSDVRNRQIVEEGLKTVFGQDWRLRCVLSEKPPVSTKVKSEKEKLSSTKPKTEDELYDIAKDIFGE